MSDVHSHRNINSCNSREFFFSSLLPPSKSPSKLSRIISQHNSLTYCVWTLSIENWSSNNNVLTVRGLISLSIEVNQIDHSHRLMCPLARNNSFSLPLSRKSFTRISNTKKNSSRHSSHSSIHTRNEQCHRVTVVGQKSNRKRSSRFCVAKVSLSSQSWSKTLRADNRRIFDGNANKLEVTVLCHLAGSVKWRQRINSRNAKEEEEEEKKEKKEKRKKEIEKKTRNWFSRFTCTRQLKKKYVSACAKKMWK